MMQSTRHEGYFAALGDVRALPNALVSWEAETIADDMSAILRRRILNYRSIDAITPMLRLHADASTTILKGAEYLYRSGRRCADYAKYR